MTIDLLTSTTTSRYTGMTPTTAVYSTSDTFTPPSGYSTSRALLCDVTVIGAGGGGAGVTNYIAGAGGNAGQVVSLTGVPVTAPVTVTVGTGGAGGAAGSSGSAGGNSSFGSVVAKGGEGGAAGAVTAEAATALMPESSAGSLGGGAALVVGIYGSGQAVETSSVGTGSWTAQSNLPKAAGSFSRIAYGNGLWVVPGANGNVMASPNGVTWTTGSIPIASVTGFIFAAGLFVAVGNTGTGSAVASSTDGLTWTAVTVPTVGTGGSWFNIAYGNGYWVLISTGATASPTVVTSPDLATWTTASLSGQRYFQYIAFGNGVFVMAENAGNASTTWTSTDGKSWSTGTASGMTSANSLKDLTFANGVFVFASNASEWWYGTDGTNWTRSTATGPTSTYPFLSAANGLFFAGNGGPAHLTSSDGTTWTNRTAVSGLQRAAGRPASSGSAVASAPSLTVVSPSGGAGGNGKTNGDGGTGGSYQPPAAATGATSAAATAGQVTGAGGGGGGLGSLGGAAGADGQVIVTYWQ